MRRALLTLAATGVLVAGIPVAAPAMADQPTNPLQANSRGAGTGLTADDGSRIMFYANEATNHQPGSGPVNTSSVYVERISGSCDVGEYPDGTNTCTNS